MLKYPNAAARANDYDLAERSSSAERLRLGRTVTPWPNAAARANDYALAERNAYAFVEPFFAELFFATCFFAGFRWPVFALYSL